MVTGFETDCRRWAEDLFGNCDLGDPRRLDRLIDYAARQATDPGGSTSHACRGDAAAREGAYRLLRNQHVEPEAICDGTFEAVAEMAMGRRTVLAIQDTTGVSFKHPVAQALADQGGPTGFVVHATLLVDGDDHMPIGLVDQERWIRDPERSREKHSRCRPYTEKESFKWEAATDRLRERMGSVASVITVCDREADIIEYLSYQVEHELRFVVRASADRNTHTAEGRLWSTLEAVPELGRFDVEIEQRGGQLGGGGQAARLPRKGRVATVSVRSAEVEVRTPAGKREAFGDRLKVNAVLVREVSCPKKTEPIEWMLLTSESVATFAEARQVVAHYEARWLIEEYFKAWKTGCRVETRPFQSPDNLERMMAITAHVAVRLLQLRAMSCEVPEGSCEQVLSRDEWQCLYAVTNPDKPLRQRAPSVRWAFEALAKFGGWFDTKHTGRIGWKTLWDGWQQFQHHLTAWRMAMRLRTSPNGEM
jgi:hypothetical protein